MPLVVEDGTIVVGADSYLSLDDVRAVALLRGITLDADNAVLESQVRAAMSYLESLRDRYIGTKTQPGDYVADPIVEPQPLQWPREDVCIDGSDFPSNRIPIDLTKALMLAVIEVHKGNELFADASRSAPAGLFTTDERLGPLGESYNVLPGGGDAKSGGLMGSTSEIQATLKPLLKSRTHSVCRG